MLPTASTKSAAVHQQMLAAMPALQEKQRRLLISHAKLNLLLPAPGLIPAWLACRLFTHHCTGGSPASPSADAHQQTSAGQIHLRPAPHGEALHAS